MPARFLAAAPLQPGLCELPETEAHHARNVLRLTPGDVVELFDGCGVSARGLVRDASKRQVTVEIAELLPAVPQRTRPQITLATAVPKGDRFDWLIEKATEIGVDRIVPLRTERSTVDPRSTKLERLRQVVLSACKQCGRNTLLQIDPVVDFAVFLKQRQEHQVCFMADLGGKPALTTFRQQSQRDACHEWITLIGPEGGWSDAERQQAGASGITQISLADYILRIETAAVAAGLLQLQCSGDAG